HRALDERVVDLLEGGLVQRPAQVHAMDLGADMGRELLDGQGLGSHACLPGGADRPILPGFWALRLHYARPKGGLPMRRPALALIALATLVTLGCAAPMASQKPFTVVETGIPELRQSLADGRVTSRQLVIAYLTRIALYEDQLKAIITVNPRVL